MKPSGARGELSPLLLGGAALVTLGLAVVLGDPTPLRLRVLWSIAAVVLALFLASRPLLGLAALAFSSVMLIVVTLPAGKGLNLFDALLLPMLAVTYWGEARRVASHSDASETGEAHEALRTARRRFSRSALVYFSLAALSLGLILFQIGRPQAIDSGLKLVRGLEGILLFPLGLVWLRSRRSIEATIGAVLAALAPLAVLNALALGSGTVQRAGMTWFVSDPGWLVVDANEAGTGLLLIWVLVLVLHGMKPRARTLLLLPVILTLLALTQSRSGLLAWLTFTMLVTLQRRQWRYVAVAGLAFLVAIPLIPAPYWERLGRTLVLERGSFEAYTALIRVFGWHAARDAFLDHPLIGVGYEGFRFVGDRYNKLGLVFGSAESYYLEVATGMGLVGLFALFWVMRRMFRLGDVVRRHAPAGSLGHRLALYHKPFLAGLLVANLTGSNFLGMVGLAQLALWSALLVRAGHESFGEGRA